MTFLFCSWLDFQREQQAAFSIGNDTFGLLICRLDIVLHANDPLISEHSMYGYLTPQRSCVINYNQMPGEIVITCTLGRVFSRM